MPFKGVSKVSVAIENDASVKIELTNAALTAKEVFDRVLPSGTIDLAVHLANFTQLEAILVTSEDSDFLLSLDGANFSARKYKTVFLQINDAGVQALNITLTAQSRVQLIAYGT